VQRQHIRLLILIIILIAAICFILLLADARLEEIDQQMPVIGMRESPLEEISRYQFNCVIASSVLGLPVLKIVHH
jgi:hypothetical protein